MLPDSKAVTTKFLEAELAQRTMIDGQKLSTKTKLEMARGALKHSVDKEEAERYVTFLGKVADGERELRALLADGSALTVMSSFEKNNVLVDVRSRHGDPITLSEQADIFPSDTLKTKVALVAG